jgi:hypothetical protein
MGRHGRTNRKDVKHAYRDRYETDRWKDLLLAARTLAAAILLAALAVIMLTQVRS